MTPCQSRAGWASLPASPVSEGKCMITVPALASAMIDTEEAIIWFQGLPPLDAKNFGFPVFESRYGNRRSIHQL